MITESALNLWHQFIAHDPRLAVLLTWTVLALATFEGVRFVARAPRTIRKPQSEKLHKFAPQHHVSRKAA
jgi:hypothetical protein